MSEGKKNSAGGYARCYRKETRDTLEQRFRASERKDKICLEDERVDQGERGENAKKTLGIGKNHITARQGKG